jgi:hypothetical protein
MLLLISPIILFLYYLRNLEKIQSNTADTKYKILFQDLKSDSIDSLLLKIIQMLRKHLYGINLIFLYDSAYIQVIINSIFSFCILHYLIYYKPYTNRKDLLINIFIEGNTFLILSLIGAYLKDKMNDIIYKMIEICISILLYGILIVPTAINLVLDIRAIVIKYKDRCMNNRQTHTTGQTNSQTNIR